VRESDVSCSTVSRCFFWNVVIALSFSSLCSPVYSLYFLRLDPLLTVVVLSVGFVVEPAGFVTEPVGVERTRALWRDFLSSFLMAFASIFVLDCIGEFVSLLFISTNCFFEV